MQSMTGYGKAEYNQDGITLTVEIKTVNNRFLDLNPKYPRCFASMDDFIRKTVQSKVKRGRAELYVTYVNTNQSGKTIQLDEGLAQKYVDVAKKLADLYSDDQNGIVNDFTISSLMRCPDVIVQTVEEQNEEELKKILGIVLNDALDNLNNMRAVEGEKLKTDILSRVSNVETLVSKVETRAPFVKADYEAKLRERMKEILSDVKFSEERMLQEVAIFADRTDICEELTRLKSHISQLRDICEGDDAGKKLDFLMQEFNREANTVCSKSNDTEVTKLGLALKNEIEKMREQVQNIE